MALTDPDGALMHEMMGRELARHGDEAQAIVNLREALKINPHLPGAHFELGELLHNSSKSNCRRRQSLSSRRRWLTIRMMRKRTWYWVRLPRSTGIQKRAFSEYSRAVELQPNDPDALVELGKMLMTMNENEKAQEMFVRAVKADPSNTVARYRLSMLYRRQGKAAEAEQQMTEYKKYKDMQKQAGEDLPRYAGRLAAEECR